jgi:hypothetical protein
LRVLANIAEYSCHAGGCRSATPEKLNAFNHCGSSLIAQIPREEPVLFDSVIVQK